MALSGTYYGPWIGSGYQRVYLTWSATQNVANNTSTITASLVWDNNAAVALSSNVSKTASITIDGTTYYGSGTVGIAAKTKKTIMTASKTITHNADGTRSFSISGAFDIKFTLGGTYYASTSASGTGTLDTIPRATQPTLSAGTTTMGNAVTINTPRASGSFTHTLRYAFGNTSGTIATGVATSYAWTIPLSLANQIPSATSGKGTIYCDTYNGSTLIGTKSVQFTATVPSSVVPTVSIGKSGVDLYSSKYVQGRSKVYVALTDNGSYGSSIVSRSTTVKSGANTITSSSSKTFTSGVINYSGTITIATTVTDSRGKTASASTTISVVAYSAPKVTAFNAFRSNSDGSPNPQGAYIRITGSSSISPIDNTNTRSTILRYRKKGASSWTDATVNTSSYSPSLAITIPADVNSSYEVQIHVADYFTSTAQSANVGTAFVLLDFHSSGKGMAMGKVAESSEILLDVGGDIYMSGSITANFRPTKIPAGANLNDYTTPGMYYNNATSESSTMSNIPYPDAFSLLVEKHAGVKQTFTMYARTNISTYVRNMYGGTWGEWSQVWGPTGQPQSHTHGTYGSNSNGHYLKMENGTLLMWNTMTLAYSSSHIYQASWAFPHALASGTSAIVVGNRSAANVGNTGASGSAFTSDKPNTASVFMRLFDPTNVMTSGLTLTVHVFAIGRWK